MPGIATKSLLPSQEVLGTQGKQLPELCWRPRRRARAIGSLLQGLSFFPLGWAFLALPFKLCPPHSGFVLSSSSGSRLALLPAPGPPVAQPRADFQAFRQLLFISFCFLPFIDHLHGFVPKIWQWCGNQSARLTLLSCFPKVAMKPFILRVYC